MTNEENEETTIIDEVTDLAPAVPEAKPQEDEGEIQSPADEGRDAIYQLYKQAQEEERSAESGDDQERDEQGRFVSKTDDEGSEEPDPDTLELSGGEELSAEVDTEEEFIDEPSPQYAIPSDEEQMIELVVDGEVRTLPLSAVTRNAQINLAANDRLQQAKDLLAAAKQQTLTPQYQQPQEDLNVDTIPVTPLAPPTSVDDERIAKWVEAIQIGDAEDGSNAMREFMDMVVNESAANQPAPQEPMDIGQEVREQMFSVRQQDAATTAFNRWSVGNEDIVKSEDATELMRATTIRNMRADLISIGVSEEELAPIANNVEALSAAHGYHNMQGRLRSYDQLLDDSSGHVRNVFRPLGAKPVSRETTKSKTQIKRNAEKTSLQQPKHGTQRTAAPKAARPKTDQEIVAGMRNARHYK